jgi:hypothetical protein
MSHIDYENEAKLRAIGGRKTMGPGAKGIARLHGTSFGRPQLPCKQLLNCHTQFFPAQLNKPKSPVHLQNTNLQKGNIMEQRFDEFVKQGVQRSSFPQNSEANVYENNSDLSSFAWDELNEAPNLLRHSLERFLMGNVV